MNSWWYIHTATLYQFPCRWTRDVIYILQLYINFPVSIFLQLNTWWYIHTATLYQFPCIWRRNDIYIPQLYINFPADEHLMIYTYRNFISTFLQMNTWWQIHTVTLYQFSCSCTRYDIYIPQLYINFVADEHGMIYTYRNFISTFLQMNGKFVSSLLQMNTWWYIHFATLYQLSCSVTLDNIYIPQLYMNFSADEHVEIYTCYNFI